MPPEPAARRVVDEMLGIGGGDVEQRDLGVGRQRRSGMVDAPLPRGFRDPDDRAHQMTCKANHKPTVDATSEAGTVSAPSR